MTVASAIDWTNVLVALIAGLPAIIAAFGVVLVHRQLRTPSGTPIGKQVEDTQHVALANNFHLRGISGVTGAPPSQEATDQASQVSSLPEGGAEPHG